ncbi:MAG: CDP-alcohol phosphatidyltransferase family protein [Bacteroidia bacterium]|nr:CDP-alcohol phosphatidyltransferase family protein [Bacteroidia bacterium]
MLFCEKQLIGRQSYIYLLTACKNCNASRPICTYCKNIAWPDYKYVFFAKTIPAQKRTILLFPLYICIINSIQMSHSAINRKKNTENIYNIPNFLSAYRILAFPFLIWMIIAGQEKLFVGFLITNLITDILDGFIARRFNMQTQFGARLDSLADVGTMIAAFAGLVIFKTDYFFIHKWGFITFAGLYLLSFLVTFIKFGRICGLHLYSFKTTGYVMGIFFAWIFLSTPPQWYYYLMVCVSCWANIEEIIIFILLKEPKSNAKGLYWVIKSVKKVNRY